MTRSAAPNTQLTAGSAHRDRADRTGLPAAARRRLVSVGAGWALVALGEASAFTILALAIRDGQGVATVLMAAAAAMLLTVLVSRAGYLAGARLAGDLYASLGSALASAQLSWFTAEHRALVAAAAGRAIPSLMGVPAHQLQTLILAPLVPALLCVSLGVVAGAATAGILAALLVIALTAQVCAQRSLARTDDARHRHERAATAGTVELVEHLELLRTAAGPTRALARAEQAWSGHEAAMARTNRAAAPATLVSALASATPLAGMLIFLVGTGGFGDPALALAILVLTTRAGAPIDDLALSGIAVGEIRAHTAAYRAAAAAPSLRQPHPARLDSQVLGRNSGHVLTLTDVGRAPAFSGVTAQIPADTRAHVAGPSGSGKSTLLGLLLRFDDPDTGTITLGGTDLTQLNEAELTSQVAYVPQDPIVFTGTLAENLRIGRPGADTEELLAAAHAAQLGAVLGRDPRGLDQDVGTHGQGLSGGERQRVAIARALVKRAPILILDEATSALDASTERRIAEVLVGLDCSLIFVTHRDPAIWRPHQTIALTGTVTV
ncbi:ABC transporter, ATP binding/permease protein [Leucobacter sp. 7(1)]|uniref:ATP-binding cassette domain-containing protein n=1 Tax=Leucobacter sp. 7(1) TaxID=1255613 RepID=UPI00097EDF76|nr:ATP-binding cassette domain-containing protein [Leucobacter sp. 7(1)]SJN11268.1 ABC transporter, ATP binding/permease protein [Leucobacter sp. 7(1)]